MKTIPSTFQKRAGTGDSLLQRNVKETMEEESDDELIGYVYVLAIVQFAVLALGMMAINILVKVEGGGSGLSAMAAGLIQVGLWAFLVPLGWIIIAFVLIGSCPENRARLVISSTGTLLIFIIIALTALSLL